MPTSLVFSVTTLQVLQLVLLLLNAAAASMLVQLKQGLMLVAASLNVHVSLQSFHRNRLNEASWFGAL